LFVDQSSPIIVQEFQIFVNPLVRVRRDPVGRWRSGLILVMLGVLFAGFSESDQPGAGAFQTSVKPFFAKSCYGCHSNALQSGGLNLQALTSVGLVEKDRDQWEMVLEKLRTGQMPPPAMPRPADSDVQQVAAWISSELARLDREAKPDPGRITARRLNRTEYNNSVRDLLGVDFQPADDFPPDDSGYGFDNIADVLSMSPSLMEKYVSAAEKVARAALYGPQQMKPTLVKHEPWYVDFDTTPGVKTEYDLTGLSLPSALHVMHRFPVEGDYDIAGLLRGARPVGSEPLQVAFWIDGKQVSELSYPIPSTGEVSGQRKQFRTHVTAGEHWLSASFLRIYEGLPVAFHGPNPSKLPPPPARGRGGRGGRGGAPGAPGQAGGRGGTAPATAGTTATPTPAGVARPIVGQVTDLPATTPVNSASGPARPPAPPGRAPRPEVASNNDELAAAAGNGVFGGGATVGFFVSNLEIIGPFNQATGPSDESRKKIFVCAEETPASAKKIVTTLAGRVYRRPATRQEVDQLAGIVAMVQQQGDSFREGLCLATQRMLISSNFLFRIEQDRKPLPTETARPVTDTELATRLSYLLWSSTPDDELLRLAAEQKLRRPGVLKAQVQRMLKDPKSSALVDDFGGQWLQFRGLESHEPDRKKFQQYTEYTKMSIQKETELFLANLIREDRPITDLIDAKYTFLNQRLAEFYGIPGVQGAEFRKVDLTGANRQGVLTQASVLTMSSYANRTSPVLRGKWVLENILNTPPPAPPPDTPRLDEKTAGVSAPLRQQLEEHRANAVCASCHSRMDPLGFALENYDAIGQWREKDGKFPIDASGQLPDGRKFVGTKGLTEILMSDPKAFAKAVTEKLLIYALGRGLESYDRPVVNQIVAGLAADRYRFSSLVLGVVNSVPFQERRAAPRNSSLTAQAVNKK
jgi:cytochrome c553